MSYVAQADIENYMGIKLTANGVATFNLLQATMQDTVDLYCNRTWNLTNPVTEYFDSYTNSNPPTLVDTFFPKYPVSETPFNPSFPRAGGINSITIGEVNGVGGTQIDLTYVYNYKSSIKLWTWFQTTTMFNPFGYKSVKIIYNSDDAGTLPTPVKQALIIWISRMIQTAPDADKDTVRVQAGTIHAYFKEDTLGEMPDFVKFVLDKYRLTPLDHF